MDKKQKAKNKGFTLVELMIVIVIIGILAAVAIPKLSKAQYKAVISEFPTVLTQIYTAEGAYEAEVNRYIACTDDPTDTEWDTLGVKIPASSSFLYRVVNVGSSPNTFTAEAEAKNPIGKVDATTKADIDQDGVKQAHGNFPLYIPTWK